MSASVEKLKEARALIARRGGWTQGRYLASVDVDDTEGPVQFNGKCGVCMYGALGVALKTDTFRDAELSDEASLLESLVLGFEYNDLHDWQDAPRRKKGEVLAAFDEAIALAEAGES